MVTGFNHSGFVVKDMDKMVEFYRDTLGLTVLMEIDSVAPPEGDHTGIPGAHRSLVFVGMENDTHRLELVQFLEPPSPDEGHLKNNYIGAAHVCFNVTDIKQLHADLSAKGIKFVTEPEIRTTPDGTTLGIVYAMDPEGNYLEFIQRG